MPERVARAAAPIGLGALAVFAGVVVLGPVVGPRFVRIVGAPVAAFRGMTGVLARDNAARNPKRTAATASALMIGVALVVLISVFATSARSSIDANIDTAIRTEPGTPARKNNASVTSTPDDGVSANGKFHLEIRPTNTAGLGKINYETGSARSGARLCFRE